MKRFLAAALVGAALLAAPTQAAVMRHDCMIKINGIIYEGTWAFVGSHPYVNVESFGKALGLPRTHNVKDWFLGMEGQPKGSPFQLAVETQKGNLPFVRYGGGTFVDLPVACKALGIPYHWDLQHRQFEVGDPYRGEWMIGAYYRWFNQKDSYYPTGTPGVVFSAGSNWDAWLTRPVPNWPAERRYPYSRPRPYPDNYHNEDNYHSEKDQNT